MKKFSFRCISCGCIATVALSLPLIAAAGTHTGKKGKRSSQATNVAGTQSGGSGGKKGKPDKQAVNRAGTQSGGGGTGQTTRSSAAVLSDLRVKNNISFVGWSPMGIPIYRFSYITEPNKRYQGTIAQAIILTRPDAVILQNGLMFVDYSRLDVAMEELPSASVAEDGHVNPQ